MIGKQMLLGLVLAPAVLLLQLSGPASAQLVRKTNAAKKTELTLAQDFARRMGQALGQDFAPDALQGEVPLALAKLLAANYQGQNLERLMKKYGAHGQAFAQRWGAYTARKEAVAAAVKEAKEKMAAKKYDAARAALVAVISPVDLDEAEGKLKRRADSLELRDAELGALEALATLAARAKTPRLLMDICTAYAGRRRVLDPASERLIWFARRVGRQFSGLGAGQKAEASRAVDQVANIAYRQSKAGEFLAHGFYDSMERHGLALAHATQRKSAKKGKWALFDLSPGAGAKLTVGDKSLTFKINRAWRIPYNCRETNKIHGVDPTSGKIIYRKKCRYRTEKTKVSLKAKLVAPPAQWAKEHFTRVWLLGKVKRAGPNWVLAHATIADLRFLYE